VIPTALALAVDHAFGPGGLHRLEVNIRPENKPSRRVVEKLGFREEAYHPRYMHIDGAWRDHIGYALTSEEVAADGGLLARWHRLRATAG
jgi:ribosomal-protein-alanine N-acetyltransferase